MRKILDEEKVRELWFSGLSNEDVAKEIGVSVIYLCRVKERFSLPARSEKADRTARPDPTEEEIEERAAEVRSGWSKRQEAERWCGGARRVRVSRYAYNGMISAFSPIDQ